MKLRFLIFISEINIGKILEIGNELPDELMGGTDATQNGNGSLDPHHLQAMGQDSTSQRHQQLSQLLSNASTPPNSNQSQGPMVPNRSPNMAGMISSLKSPLSNSLSSPPHSGNKSSVHMVDMAMASSSASLSMANSTNTMVSMSNPALMKTMGGHNIGMGNVGMSQTHNSQHVNGPQYTTSGLDQRSITTTHGSMSVSQSGMLSSVGNQSMNVQNLGNAGIQNQQMLKVTFLS